MMQKALAEIAKLRRELTEFVKQQIAGIFIYSRTTASSAIGEKDAVEGADGDKGQRPVTRIEPWGHRGRPPGKLRGLSLRLGSSNVLFIGIAPTEKYGPQNVEEGETVLYSIVQGAEVRLDKDGNVIIQPAPGTGEVRITATALTGAVKLGPVGNLPVLVQGTVDSLGVPVTQNPAATNTIVKAG